VEPSLPLDATDAARWHTIFMLLSMERVEEFWSDMELPVRPDDALRDIARAFVGGYRAITADPVPATEQRLAAYGAMLARTFERIADELGADTAEALGRWGNRTFQYDPAGDARAYFWRLLLRRLAGLSGLAYPLVPLALPEERLAAVRAAVVAHLGTPGDLRRRLQAVERAARSPWEEQIYATYSPDASPLDWVENTIEYARLLAAWRAITTLLREDELAVLQHWGVEQARTMEMPAESVTLPRFDDSASGPD
jgi:hypothetical protein